MKFLVKKQQIDCIERDKLADGQIAFVSFRFVFDNEWEGLYKVVQFMQGENTYNISLGVDGYSCKMPSELQAGCAEMSYKMPAYHSGKLQRQQRQLVLL